jgi:hypothetical protein
MGFWVIFGLLVVGGLVAGLIAAAARIRPAMRTPRSARAVLWMFGSFLVLLALVTVAHYKPDADRVVGSPARAQVTGTWGGPEGNALVLRPDGTFSAAWLPLEVGTAAPVFTRDGRDVLWSWSGHGTWVIGPGKFRASPQSVVFTVDCTAGPGGCAGGRRSFELQLETNAPSGGGGPALFYYLGKSRDLTSQYYFVRVQ